MIALFSVLAVAVDAAVSAVLLEWGSVMVSVCVLYICVLKEPSLLVVGRKFLLFLGQESGPFRSMFGGCVWVWAW